MKIIKFRAWNKEDKIMVDLQKITPLALNDMMNTQLNLQGRSGLFIPFFKELELMQYTGLHDKNNKEIYEGDIVKCTVTENSADYLQIEAGDKHSVLRIILIPDLYQEGLSDDGEIIGNIYENPELIKETK